MNDGALTVHMGGPNGFSQLRARFLAAGTDGLPGPIQAHSNYGFAAASRRLRRRRFRRPRDRRAVSQSGRHDPRFRPGGHPLRRLSSATASKSQDSVLLVGCRSLSPADQSSRSARRRRARAAASGRRPRRSRARPRDRGGRRRRAPRRAPRARGREDSSGAGSHSERLAAASPRASRRRRASGSLPERASIPARSAVARKAVVPSALAAPPASLCPLGELGRCRELVEAELDLGELQIGLGGPIGLAVGEQQATRLGEPLARRGALASGGRRETAQPLGIGERRAISRRSRHACQFGHGRADSIERPGVELGAATIEERDGVVRARGARGEKRERFGEGGVRFRHPSQIPQRLARDRSAPRRAGDSSLRERSAPLRDGAVRRGRGGRAASRYRRGCRG